METEKAGGASRIALVMRSVRTGIFGTLFVIQKKVHASTSRSILASVIRLFQMISFVIGHAFHAWQETTIKPVRFVLALTTVHGYWSYFTPSIYLGLFYFSLVWVTLFIGLTIWAMQSFVRNQFTVLWPLKILRSIGTFSASVLYIPLFTLLMSGFQCNMAENPFWGGAGYNCYGGGHLVQSILSAVLSITFFVLCSLFSLVFYDSNSLSGNIVAKAHGRADFLFLCIKSVLVITIEIFPSMFPSGVLVALLIAAGAIWCLSVGFFMPYYDHRWNAWSLSQSCAFFYCTICLLISELYPGYDAAVTLYLGIPLAAIAGTYAAAWRAAYIVHTPALRLSSPYEIELKARYLIHQGLWGHYTSRLGVTNQNTNGTTVNTRENDKLNHTNGGGSSSFDHTSHTDKKLGSTDASSHSNHSNEHLTNTHNNHDGPHNNSNSQGGGNGGGYGETANAMAIDDAEGSDDIDVRMQAARRLMNPSVLLEVHALMRTAVIRFRASSILHVFFSRFYLLQGNRHMQMSHLLQAERRHPPLDVAFLVFQARKLAEDNTGTNGQMSALNRVTFEKYSGDARKFVLRAAMRQLAFWTELLDVQPDLSRLHTLSSEMNDAITAAERCFMELFAINPQSLVIMRLYAAFNSYVCCNPDKAAVLLQEAERIEDQKTKDHRLEGSGNNLHIMSESGLDIMADNTAVITVGGSQRNLGTILTANAQTTKAFGYSRLQLERRQFFSLLPHPIDRIMESMLRQYVSTGEGKIASTYVVFGQSKLGSITPMLMCMRETPADEGPPSFIVLMRELRSQDNYILLNADYHITSASSGGYEVLGIDSSSLLAAEVSVSDFVLEWDAILNDLATNRGTSFCFDRGSAHRSGHLPIELDENGMETGNETPMHSNAINDSNYNPSNGSLFMGGTNNDSLMNSSNNLLSNSRRSSVGNRSLNASISNSFSGNMNMSANNLSLTNTVDNGKVYVRGTLQTVHTPDADTFHVLSFQRLSSNDSYGLAKAAKRRRESLQALGMLAGISSGPSVTSSGESSEGLVANGMLANSLNVHGGPLVLNANNFPGAGTNLLHFNSVPTKSNIIYRHSLGSTTGDDNGSYDSNRPLGDDDDDTVGSVMDSNRPQQDADEIENVTATSTTKKISNIRGTTGNKFPKANMVNDRHSSFVPEAAHVPPPHSILTNHRDAQFVTIDSTTNESSTVMNDNPSLPVSPIVPDTDTIPSPVVTMETSTDVPSVTAELPKSERKSVRLSEQVTHHHPHHYPPRPSTPRTNKNNGKHGSNNPVASGTNLLSSSYTTTAPLNSNLDPNKGPPKPTVRRGSDAFRRQSDAENMDDNNSQRNGTNGLMERSAESQRRNEMSDRHSQGSSVSYSRKTMNRLRRVLADSGQSLLRGLYFLRLVGIVITILSIALSVSVAIVMQGQFSDYRDNLLYTSLGASRILHLFDLVLGVQELHFGARGWREFYNNSEALTRSELYNNVTEFNTIHRDMYKMVQGQSLAASYSTNDVIITRYDMPDSGYLGTLQPMNLFQAGLMISSTAAEISRLPLVNFTRERFPQIAFIFSNGISGGKIHERIQESLELGYEMSLETRKIVSEHDLGVYVGMSSLLLFIGLFVFIPILLSVESAKDAIVKRFVYLPQLVRLSLQRQAEKRVRALRRNYSEDDEDDEDDMADDDDNGPTGNTMNGGNMSLGNGSTMDDDEDVDWDRILATINNANNNQQSKAAILAKVNASNPAATSYNAMKDNFPESSSPIAIILSAIRNCSKMARSKRTMPAYQKGFVSIITLFAKFLGPLIALFFFFSVVYVLSEQTLEMALRLSSAQVAAANRAACIRELYMDVRRTLMITQDRYFLNQLLSKTRESIDCINYQQSLMLFGTQGDEEHGLYSIHTPVMETGSSPYLNDYDNEALYTTQYGNACEYIKTHTTSTMGVIGCEDFSNGIVKQGIEVVTNEYIRRAQILLDRRERAFILQGHNTYGDGYIVDINAFNYSEQQCKNCWDVHHFYDTPLYDDVSPVPDYSVNGEIDPLTYNPIDHNATPYSIAAELKGENMMWMSQATTLYLTPVFTSFQNLYETAGVASIDNFLRFLNIFVTVFIIFFVLFMMIVFMPQVKATNTDIQKKRGMLLFLPPQVVRNVRNIRTLVDEILADDSGGGARGTSLNRGNGGLTSKGGSTTIIDNSSNSGGVNGNGGEGKLRMADTEV